jgi:hypothetical protein
VSTHWTERLSEYLDDELSTSERDACAAHLAECQSCRVTLDELRQVVALAQSDRDVMPTADLWPGVLERIVPTSARVTSPISVADAAAARRAPRRISFTLPQLALAASLLIAVSAGISYFAMNRGPAVLPARSIAAEPMIHAVAEPSIPPSSDVVLANFADAQFDRAVSDLERILVEQRDELDPGTVMVIERNLAAIDEAIRQARAALEADPANPFLNSHLAESRRRKLDLLRHATTLNSAGD